MAVTPHRKEEETHSDDVSRSVRSTEHIASVFFLKLLEGVNV